MEVKKTKKIGISLGLFRYAVEVEIMIMILSELADVPPAVMAEYRKEAVRNVQRTRGKTTSKKFERFNGQRVNAESV